MLCQSNQHLTDRRQSECSDVFSPVLLDGGLAESGVLRAARRAVIRLGIALLCSGLLVAESLRVQGLGPFLKFWLAVSWFERDLQELCSELAITMA